jgi:hypothetical protein
MKEEDPGLLGCLAGPIIFTLFVAFCVFMFWLCMQLTGTEL